MCFTSWTITSAQNDKFNSVKCTNMANLILRKTERLNFVFLQLDLSSFVADDSGLHKQTWPADRRGLKAKRSLD